MQKFGKLLFMHVNDGRSADTIQVVLSRSVLPVSSSLTVGSAIEVHGDWVPSIGTQQSMELFAHTFTIHALNQIDVSIYIFHNNSFWF